ncbi:MAG: hypothetical protein J0G97_16970, partial [Rhizobium pusense]|nr:hypothetical protein [Agrobacterium pusense]
GKGADFRIGNTLVVENFHGQRLRPAFHPPCLFRYAAIHHALQPAQSAYPKTNVAADPMNLHNRMFPAGSGFADAKPL